MDKDTAAINPMPIADGEFAAMAREAPRDRAQAALTAEELEALV